MLSQIYNRKDASKQGLKDNYQNGLCHSGHGKRRRRVPVSSSLFVFILLCLTVATLSCGSPPTDPRTVMPADSLVYMETKDLGALVAALTESEIYQQAAVTKPDLSGINGIEMAVAVTGFETTEQELTEENSILNFQPRFVAVAETRFWNFQVLHFVEEELGLFISEAYGGEALLETSKKHDGDYYVWKSQDGRKAYALVIGSLVFFGNDETAIEKCLAVKRGEVPSIAGNPKLTSDERIAFGYISPEGIGQLANISGISMAQRAGGDPETQSFIARLLPELLRNSLKEATWTAVKTDNGIEDRFDIVTNTDVATVLNETLVPSGNSTDGRIIGGLPATPESITRYDLRDPQVAWRSVLLTGTKLTDEVSGAILMAFSSAVFEPYGVDAPEALLSSVGPVIYTVRFDEDGEKAIFIASVKDAAKVKTSLAKEFEISKPPEKVGEAETWLSKDNDVRALFVDDIVVAGDPEEVLEFHKRFVSAQVSPADTPLSAIFAGKQASAVTVTNDRTTALKVADVISDKKEDAANVNMRWITETRFNRSGIERKMTSQLGLIGLIASQFAKE
ncbi:MAG: hypothetical protein KF855_01935 [Acidobacteria bacterium]|nr:hypothetical protein [Acidobacteriota bacterium]